MRFPYWFVLLILFLGACNGSDSTSLQSGSVSGTSSGGTSSPGAGGGLVAPSDPTPTPIASPSPIASTDPCALDAEELAFLGLINQYREQNGVGALTLSPELCASSAWLSQDMATKAYLDHTDSTGRTFDVRIADFGYTNAGTIGENIAYGYATGADTFTQWKNSPPHNANMLDGSYQAIGIARFNYSGTSWGWYWTTDFGGVVK